MKVELSQACIRFGAAAKRYLEAVEKGDIKALITEGLEVTRALELTAQLVCHPGRPCECTPADNPNGHKVTCELASKEPR